MTGAPVTVQDDRTVLFEFQKSAAERIRIASREYRGKVYIDLRVWFVAEGGEYRPSSKGVTIKPSQIPELIQGLGLAARAVDPQGGTR